MTKKNKMFRILLAALLLVVGGFIIYHVYDFLFVKINTYNVKSILEENKKFLFTAEFDFEKSSLYICDPLKDTYELRFASKEYSIKYFCVDEDIIYFTGKKDNGFDIIKLIGNKEEVIASIECQYVYGIGKNNNKLFIVEGDADTVEIYYLDLNTSEVVKYCDISFYSDQGCNPVFCSDGDIIIYGKEKSDFYQNMVYLIKDGEVIPVTYAYSVYKYEGKLFGDFNVGEISESGNVKQFRIFTGYYDFDTKKPIRDKKHGKFLNRFYFDISKDNKYGLGYGGMTKYKFSLGDPPDFYSNRSLAVNNLKTGKVALVKCLVGKTNDVCCWRWL